jgi:hypothetical protein
MRTLRCDAEWLHENLWSALTAAYNQGLMSQAGLDGRCQKDPSGVTFKQYQKVIDRYSNRLRRLHRRAYAPQAGR